MAAMSFTMIRTVTASVVLRTLVAGALIALAPSAFAVEYKLGFVNTERLFREATPAKRAQAKIEKEFATRDGEIQKLAKQVRDLQAVLDKDGPTMAESAMLIRPTQSPSLALSLSFRGNRQCVAAKRLRVGD